VQPRSGAAERERDDPRRRDRHLVGEDHAARALDRRHELGAARRDAARPLEIADQAVPQQDFLARVDLGRDQPDQTRHADDGVEVGAAMVAVD
jgi:hypothetical protein